MTLAETRALLANAGARKAEGLRFDLIHKGVVGVDDVHGDPAKLDNPAAFVRDLYGMGFQPEGDLQGWPCGDRDTYTAATVDGDAVLVVYGPDPDGATSWAAYVIEEPDATRWTVVRDGLPETRVDSYREAHDLSNGGAPTPFKIIPPLTEL